MRVCCSAWMSLRGGALEYGCAVVHCDSWLCVGRAGVCVKGIIGGVGVPTRDPGRWRCVGASRRSCVLAAFGCARTGFRSACVAWRALRRCFLRARPCPCPCCPCCGAASCARALARALVVLAAVLLLARAPLLVPMPPLLPLLVRMCPAAASFASSLFVNCQSILVRPWAFCASYSYLLAG